MKKPNNKKRAEETLGILAHLQKNIPDQAQSQDQEKEFPEDEEEDIWGVDLLKPKPPIKIMGSN